jgi:DNA-directed RNA polymerase specialized sigma24 family protein
MWGMGSRSISSLAGAALGWGQGMDGVARPLNRNLRISPIDRRGRAIGTSVLNAAEQIGRRAIDYAGQMLIDPAIAATLLEEAAATVSRTINSKRHSSQSGVLDLPSYLFRAFIRRVDRAKKRQLIQEAAITAHSAESPNSRDPKADLDLKILIDELLTRSDSVTRDMFYRRIQGFSWNEIGSLYDISGHAAESRFSQAIRKLAQKLDLKANV